MRQSKRLRGIMQTVLSIGNALNEGTARGQANAFKLNSLLKLTELRGKQGFTALHYLCQVIADKQQDILEFHHDLPSLEVREETNFIP